MSNGAPTTATSWRPTSCTSSMYGALRKVLMPANAGCWPRANVEMVRSFTDGAASRPYSSPRSIASRCFRSGMSASLRMFRIPLKGTPSRLPSSSAIAPPLGPDVVITS